MSLSMSRPRPATGTWPVLALPLEPAQAASIRVSCPDCEDIPAWAIGLLVVVETVLAMAILWLPQRVARNIESPPVAHRLVEYRSRR